jgi:hypothetical protein
LWSGKGILRVFIFWVQKGKKYHRYAADVVLILYYDFGLYIFLYDIVQPNVIAKKKNKQRYLVLHGTDVPPDPL